jgi:hypothetical protein
MFFKELLINAFGCADVTTCGQFGGARSWKPAIFALFGPPERRFGGF